MKIRALEWQNWLQAEIQNRRAAERPCSGLRFWGQIVTALDEVPMPMYCAGDAQPGAVAGLAPF